MKVLIADKFEKVGVDGLKELGCTVVSQPDVKAEDLPAAIRAADPHILIVRGKKVSADALRAGTALTLVIRAGAG
jgi:phosphoglycerate dehydrogenase-like enzyme